MIGSSIMDVGLKGAGMLVGAIKNAMDVKAPTFALIGEAGPEMVVPLKRYQSVQR